MSDTLTFSGSPFLRRLVEYLAPQVVDAGREVVPGQFTLVHFQRAFASALIKNRLYPGYCPCCIYAAEPGGICSNQQSIPGETY